MPPAQHPLRRLFTRNEPASLWCLFVLAYIITIQALDCIPALMHSIPLSPWVRGLIPRTSFDLYKFTFKFCIPLMLSLPTLERQYFSIRSYNKKDWSILAALILISLCSLLIIQLSPELSRAYVARGDLPWDQKMIFVRRYLLWLLSWYPGWEFMHRYMLTRAAHRAWPKHGWILVPLAEFVYHLQKPMLEALGMGVLSIVLTKWVIARKSIVFPFLVHLVIELGLIVYLIM